MPADARLREAVARSGPLVRCLAALAVVVALTPQWGAPVESGIDGAFRWALSRLDDAGWAPGRDWAFPYGPLAATWRPAGDASALVRARPFLLGLHALFAAALVAVVLRRRTPETLAAALLLVAAHAVAGSNAELAFGLLTALLVVAAGTAGRGAAAWTAAAGAVAGAAVFVKNTAGAVSLVVLAGGLAAAATGRPRRERAGVVAAGVGGWVGVCAALAAVYFPGVRDLATWVRFELEYALGFSSAMSQGDAGADVAGAVLAVLLLSVLAARRAAARSRWAGWTFALALSLYVSFKHAFVRADWHPWIFVGWALALSALALLTAEARGERRLGLALAAVALAVGAVRAERDPAASAAWRDEASGRAGWRRLAAFASLAERRAELAERSRAALRETRWRRPELARWRRGGDAVDVLSWDLAAVSANRLSWAPQPSLQLYQAYTPWLDGRNAAHFAGGGGPRRLLVHLAPIDGRHPLWEAPATWDAVQRAYAPRRVLAGPPGLLVLERRERPTAAVDLGTAELQPVQAGSWTDLPPGDGEMLLLDLDLRPTLLGRLRELVYRTEPLYLHVGFDGTSRPRRIYRLLPRLARGLRLDAAPESLAELAAVLDGGDYPRVRRFRPVGAGWESYRQPFAARLRRVARTPGAPPASPQPASVVAQRFDRPAG